MWLVVMIMLRAALLLPESLRQSFDYLAMLPVEAGAKRHRVIIGMGPNKFFEAHFPDLLVRILA